MADPTLVFPQLKMQTHMPFTDGKTLVFCGSEAPIEREFSNRGHLLQRMRRDKSVQEHFSTIAATSRVAHREWKLFHCPLGSDQPVRLHTGLPNGAIECSPAFYWEGACLHLTFVGGIPTRRGIVYHLYQMKGESFNQMSEPARLVPKSTRAGSANQKYICFVEGEGLTVLEPGTRQRTVLDCSLDQILRATFRADDSDDLLITGLSSDRQQKTLAYHLKTKRTAEVRSQTPVYKSTLFGKRMIVASKDPVAGIEPYRLLYAEYALEPSQETVSSRS